VFALDTAMGVKHRTRLCIGQHRRLDRLDSAATSLELVRGTMTTFEKRAVQRDVSGSVKLLR